VKNEIVSRTLDKYRFPKDIQIICIEIRLKSKVWLCTFVYRPPKLNLNYFLEHLTKALDFYSYKNCIVIGDFNTEPENTALNAFFQENMLNNHMKSKTCFKSTEGSCIDLILSNQKFLIKHTDSVDTGISDFHHMVYAILKSKYSRLPPKKVHYRTFKKFSEESFLKELSQTLSATNIVKYELFESLFESVLDKHAPQKTKLVRGNEKPHMNKILRKAIMKRSYLRNAHLKSPSLSTWQAYKDQRNYVTSLNLKTKKAYFQSAALNPSQGDGKFWEICKPFMHDKSTEVDKIVLLQDEKVISNDVDIARIFNTHFTKITTKLNLETWTPPLKIKTCFTDPISKIIIRYRDHPSINKIKSLIGDAEYFDFSKITLETVQKHVMSLKSNKASSGNINAKMLKLASSVCSPYLNSCINNSIDTGKFPDSLKCASITPIFKKGDKTQVKNYRPISILPAASKLFEKVLADQLGMFFKTRFSSLLCGFRKGHSTQHALLRLLHKWQSNLDNSCIVGTVLMDLSKAYDCLPHELLIAKLAAYGVGHHSLTLLNDYLTKRLQRTKFGTSFSDWLEVLLGIPQGSILGPLLFNIFINDLLFFIEGSDICNFADDNTLYAFGKSVNEVRSVLENEIVNVLNWFKNNSMTANPEKFQIMFLGTNDYIPDFLIQNISVPVVDCVKLLGVNIDKKLNFRNHVDKICNNAARKTKALLRIRPYISSKVAMLLCEAYIFSQFNYCPVIWMGWDKYSNAKLDKVQLRALRAVYNDFTSSLEKLLSIENKVTLHIRTVWNLLTEIFKTLNGYNPSFLSDLFQYKSSIYTLRSGRQLTLPQTKTVRFGIRSKALA